MRRRHCDEDANARVIPQARFDGVQVAELSQVGLEHFNGDVVFATQLCGERFQARVVAGDQHQIMPAFGETLGVNRADASGSASDQNGRASSHVSSLFLGT